MINHITGPKRHTSPASDAEAHFKAAYLDDGASTQAFWQRAYELLKEQDDVIIDAVGNLTIAHDAKTVILHRDDLGSIAHTPTRCARTPHTGWTRQRRSAG